MQQIKWFDRKFNFTDNQNIFPSIIERLNGTSLRLADKISRIPIAHLTVKINNSWSILENIGHLIDLEPLWQGRLEDILNNATELRPTDLQNRKTDLANHNGRKVESLLNEFSEIRNVTLIKLEALREEDVFKSALHPRLKTPMRTMDLFLFVAEHDDHHLARITEINKILSQSNETI
jgi:uncharacterized damage-inducible protein DinB